MTGRKPLTRVCEACGEPKPWRGGHEPLADEGQRRFICAECCHLLGGKFSRKAGWRFPAPAKT